MNAVPIALNKAGMRKYEDLEVPCENILASYVWVDSSGIDLRSKDRTFDFVPKEPKDLPVWYYDGSNTGQASPDNADTFIFPEKIYHDPFRRGSHILVLGDTYQYDYKPTASNYRKACVMSCEKAEVEDPWFGFNQEFFLTTTDNRPLGWPPGGFPSPPGPYYCAIGANKIVARDLMEAFYRFFRSTACYIIDMVKNDLAGDSRGGFIPPHLKVLAAIRTWAREEFQDDAGDISGMSQPTISLICKQVALAIVAHRAQWIRMPQTDAEQNNVIADFYSLCGFRQVIGAIDCTHARIPKVGGDVGQYYINRKGYSSINVQVVANANLEIMDIVAHWRGSTHDSRIFNESRLKQRFERSEFKGKLLGDSGYACTPYLFTPVLRPTREKEENYNKAHIRTRNVVERCFGVWKQRFQCLLRGFSTRLENTKLYIVALAVLHNIAMHRQDIEEVEDSDDTDDTVPVTPAISACLRGNAVRAAFINNNF